MHILMPTGNEDFSYVTSAKQTFMKENKYI